MELPDTEALRALRDLIVLLKDADVQSARIGDIELHFAPPPPPEPLVERLPPGLTGIKGQEPKTDEPQLPPGYSTLFPGGVPRRPTRSE